MKNLQLNITRRGCEVMIVRLSAEREDGTKVFRDIDLGGNATTAMYAGAVKAIQAVSEMLEQPITVRPEEPKAGSTVHFHPLEKPAGFAEWGQNERVQTRRSLW